MTLLEAFEILKRSVPEPASTQHIYLACGFTPLHLKTFLEAHLRVHYPAHRIEITSGLYGDLYGNLERFRRSSAAAVCILVEWSDFDPRLGIRSHGSWRAEEIPDIVSSACHQSRRLTDLIQQIAEKVPTYFCPPTLPLPPLFINQQAQADHYKCQLRCIATLLATSVSKSSQARVLDSQLLDEMSPLGHRFNPKAEIHVGFPYTFTHASSVGELMATLLRNPAPKKGIITDLDDTLWAGVLGEIGVEGISWDTAAHAHLHGLYQRFLDALASAGILLGVASKNDSALADKALARGDILLSRERLFPLEINWGLKSLSVGRILRQWNLMPADVVFIDDSPMEVAEVQSSYPEMECIVFPKNDPSALWELFKRLRVTFGKYAISGEDKIRSESIRAAAAFTSALGVSGETSRDFLRDADATISFSLECNFWDSRTFELLNKTNQFNLNGRRINESEWVNILQEPSTMVLSASYKDKYGPLGKIAVIVGKATGHTFKVKSWVMSCRAFSRQIEHHCLEYLFDAMAFDEIVFEYETTPRNEPMQRFLKEVVGEPLGPNPSLSKTVFAARKQGVFHRVVEVNQNEKISFHFARQPQPLAPR